MIIPEESRAIMTAYRKGCSLEKFLDDMWLRREQEKPRQATASDGWPYGKVTPTPKDRTIERLYGPLAAVRNPMWSA